MFLLCFVLISYFVYLYVFFVGLFIILCVPISIKFIGLFCR
jgi:hypothetical protein